METEKTMSERLDKWLTGVAEQCDKYARETDLDFYVFQSDRPSQPGKIGACCYNI